MKRWQRTVMLSLCLARLSRNCHVTGDTSYNQPCPKTWGPHEAMSISQLLTNCLGMMWKKQSKRRERPTKSECSHGRAASPPLQTHRHNAPFFRHHPYKRTGHNTPFFRHHPYKRTGHNTPFFRHHPYKRTGHNTPFFRHHPYKRTGHNRPFFTFTIVFRADVPAVQSTGKLPRRERDETMEPERDRKAQGKEQVGESRISPV